MTQKPAYQSSSKRQTRGFKRTSGLLQGQIRHVSESRGFAVSRLLTHWADIVGEATARAALPVKVGYSQGGMGATLTVLTTGAQAPMLQADLPRIKDKVNACYGYAAIARIRITQTAPIGFSEGQVAFDAAKKPAPAAPDPKAAAAAKAFAAPVENDDLRTALELLGANIISQTKP